MKHTRTQKKEKSKKNNKQNTKLLLLKWKCHKKVQEGSRISGERDDQMTWYVAVNCIIMTLVSVSFLKCYRSVNRLFVMLGTGIFTSKCNVTGILTGKCNVSSVWIESSDTCSIRYDKVDEGVRWEVKGEKGRLKAMVHVEIDITGYQHGEGHG